jgi:DNA-binding MarR family transcriptional regulator
MASEKLSDIIFYSLEKSIKTYRQFAQRKITEANRDITIDQWLVLKTLQELPAITQQQLAIVVFKDYASITRIIDLLVHKRYLKRISHATDRRRFELTITKDGAKVIDSLRPVIKNNRSMALKGISREEIELLQITLNKIITNTQS